MEAQANAQKLAAQQVAHAAALRGLQEEPIHHDEPTDLTMDAEEKALRMRERNNRDERDREQLDPRHSQFDFRHLIPQVSIKSEWLGTFNDQISVAVKFRLIRDHKW